MMQEARLVQIAKEDDLLFGQNASKELYYY